MYKSLQKLAVVTALGSAGIVAMSLPAYAQNDMDTTQTATSSTQMQKKWLSMREILTRVETSGYSDIREIDREENGYEIKARNKDGQMVKLYVEPLNGNVINEKRRDDHHHD